MRNRLKVYRAMKDISQEDLANAVNVTRQTIIAIERRKYDPSLSLAFKLARFFDVSIDELFRFEE